MLRHSLRVLGAVFASGLLTGAAHAADLTVGLSTPITSLDPHFHNLTPNNSLAQARVRNAGQARTTQQRMQPGLAESWKPLNDTRLGIQAAQGREVP